MSSKDHSSMYKSRTGNHSKMAVRGNRANDQLRKKRTDARQNEHAAHRIIEPTPMKKMQSTKPTINGTAAEHLRVTDAVASTAAASGNGTEPKLSRQQAFRLKFAQYREDKAAKALKNKAIPAPFVSVVPIGRFINPNEKKIIKKPNGLLKVVPSQLQRQLANEAKSKYSPINTRSRKRQLVSPSQLPIPRRKSRSKADAVLPSNGHPPSKSEIRIARKTPIKTPNKIPIKTPSKTPNKTSIKTPIKTPSKTPNKTPSKVITKSVKDVDIKPDFALTVGIDASFSSKNTSTVAKKKPSETKTSGEQGVRGGKLAFNFNDSIISPIEFTATKEDPLVPATEANAPKRRQSKLHVKAANNPVPIENNIDLNTTPLNTDDLLNNSANYVSPFVTIARGSRRSKSKEEDARNTKYQLNSRRSVLNDSIEARQNREAATYFRQQMAKETERLVGLVDEWLAYKEAHLNDIPSDYMDLIDVAAGQTRLLISSKFKQFHGLCDQCEQGAKDQLVSPLDLEGFWNMVFLQVENCNKRFERMTALKDNGWQDPDLKRKIVKKKKEPLHGVTSKNSLQAKPARSNSTLSKMLQAARKQFNENKTTETKKTILTNLQNESMHRVSSPRKNGRTNIWIVSN